MLPRIAVRSTLLFVACALSQVSALYFTSPTSSSTTTSETETTFAPLGSATDVFNEGGLCRASWTPDTTGDTKWKSMTVQLMTGSNLQMTALGTVASGIDGTTTSITVFNYSCPQVTPNAAIYFLQYTHDGGQDPMWTTRFAIADQGGNTVAPPEANQPQGGSPAIPWGQGRLVSVGGNSSSTAEAATSTTSSTSTRMATRTATALRSAKTTNQQQQLANAFSSIFSDDDQANSQSQFASGAASMSAHSPAIRLASMTSVAVALLSLM